MIYVNDLLKIKTFTVRYERVLQGTLLLDFILWKEKHMLSLLTRKEGKNQGQNVRAGVVLFAVPRSKHGREQVLILL